MSVRVEIAVQHHPKRDDLLPALLASAPSARVVTDPEPTGFPSPWRCYRACLESAAAGTTHIACLQDDVTLTGNFEAGLDAAVRARPDSLLVLFHGGQPHENLPAIYRACDRGEAWIRPASWRWIPAVALVWPVRLIAPALEFVDEQNWPERFRADDEIIGRAMRHLAESPLVAVPSLVEHADMTPSLVGRRAMQGRDPSRVAACFAGEDCDATEIDWDAGAA